MGRSIVLIMTPRLRTAVDIRPSISDSSPLTLTTRILLLLGLLICLAGGSYSLRRPAPAGVPTVPVQKQQPDKPLPDANVTPQQPVRRVMDDAGFLSDDYAARFDDALLGLYDESGVDVRFIFAREIPGDLESFALQRARDLGVGRDTDRRALLFVYDVAGKRMRIEVGPGLEGIFPDGFVGFLVREQTAAFFAAGNRHLALKSTLDVVMRRLREASLGGTYDPRAVAYINSSTRLAAGAGANTRADAERGRDLQALRTGVSSAEVRERFAPQPSVAATFTLYLEALRDGYYQPDLPLYTSGTQAARRQFPIAAPFAQMIILTEYGQRFKIVERGDLAILYFTTTPLVSAHLFRRSPAGWQLDIAAEIRDTHEFTASAYTWTMIPSGDDYSRAFADLFSDFGFIPLPPGAFRRPGMTRFLRPADGDNRPLPTRHKRALPTPVTATSSTDERSFLLPMDASHSEDFGYPTQTIDRLAVRGLLFARSFDALDALMAAYSDSVRLDYRLEYRLFEAYAAFEVAMPSLEEPLTEWVQERPTSAAARLARATFLRASGWNARGLDGADQTSREQFKRMDDFFRRASLDLAVARGLAPGSINAYYQLMDIATAHGDEDAARQLLARGLSIQVYSFLLRAAYMRSLLPRWGGSYEAMAEFAEESMPYAIRNPRIRALAGFADWHRGRVLAEENDDSQAIQAYSRAIEFGDFWLFRYHRGGLYYWSGQKQAALEDLNRVLAQYPRHTDALYKRCRLSYDLAREGGPPRSDALFSQAYRDIELAAAVDPTNEDYREQLAFIRTAIPDFEPPRRR